MMNIRLAKSSSLRGRNPLYKHFYHISPLSWNLPPRFYHIKRKIFFNIKVQMHKSSPVEQNLPPDPVNQGLSSHIDLSKTWKLKYSDVAAYIRNRKNELQCSFNPLFCQKNANTQIFPFWAKSSPRSSALMQNLPLDLMVWKIPGLASL